MPIHVTARNKDKDFFSLPLDDVWKIMLEELLSMSRSYRLAVHAFILMGNHFHLLCHTPLENIDQIMNVFLSRTSQKIPKHSWDASYKLCLIESHSHYFQVYRYIFQNPLRAKICENVQDYPYSTLKTVPLPLHSFIPLSFGGVEGEILWLNEHYENADPKMMIFNGGLKILSTKS
jgi:putative transposase